MKALHIRNGATKSLLLRETGFALSALAIWLLVLLSPLHQAANALVEFQKAGLLSEDAVILCQPSGKEADSRGATPPTCPFQLTSIAIDMPAVLTPTAAYQVRAVADPPPSTMSPPRLRLQSGPRQPTGPPHSSQA